MRAGLQGHLDLICSADARGRSYLRHQSFRAPAHLSKPHEDAGTLVVNVVNPTAGLLAGDRISVRVAVERGARLLLTTPSASRVHRMEGQGCAEVAQDYSVEGGGSLEVWPELLIPQSGCRYRQKTTLQIAPEGELIFFESLAPGRVAMGEAFAFTALEWRTDLFVDLRLRIRERYTLEPQGEAVRALRRRFADCYYGSCFAVSPRLVRTSPCWTQIAALHEQEAWVGCTAWSEGGGVIKVAAAGSILLRAKLTAVRQILYEALGRHRPNLRRAGG